MPNDELVGSWKFRIFSKTSWKWLINCLNTGSVSIRKHFSYSRYQQREISWILIPSIEKLLFRIFSKRSWKWHINCLNTWLDSIRKQSSYSRYQRRGYRYRLSTNFYFNQHEIICGLSGNFSVGRSINKTLKMFLKILRESI